MELLLNRIWLTDQSTCGELFIDGVEECNTLELPVKDGLPGSAIPPGRYQVIIAYSPRFERNMPLLVDVPKRSAIEIHMGDWPHNTEGCILTGKYIPTKPDQLTPGSSTPAFDHFYYLIEPAASVGACWITINGGIPSANWRPPQP
jgi:hypothetical protein